MFSPLSRPLPSLCASRSPLHVDACPLPGDNVRADGAPSPIFHLEDGLSCAERIFPPFSFAQFDQLPVSPLSLSFCVVSAPVCPCACVHSPQTGSARVPAKVSVRVSICVLRPERGGSAIAPSFRSAFAPCHGGAQRGEAHSSNGNRSRLALPATEKCRHTP